jgi:hypothetical protein
LLREDKMEFSRPTMSVLREAGWQPGRQVDTTQYLHLLQSEGYEPSRAVDDFLRDFGGIRVVFPRRNVPGQNEEFHFDPAIAAHHASPGWVKSYSARVGAQLCPIGEAGRGYMLLTMDPTGRVFAGYDDLLWKVGNTGRDAIEALSSERKLEAIT